MRQEQVQNGIKHDHEQGNFHEQSKTTILTQK